VERTGSLFKVLVVEPGASQKEIDVAYKKQAKTYHPDRVASMAPEVRDMAELRMKENNAANAELKHRAR
jgi:DnaJ like chaperone protein